MAFSDQAKHSFYYHYSPTYKFSVGVEAVEIRQNGDEHSYLRLTYLLDRKNTQDSQRNLYLQSGVDPVDLDHYFYGVHGDWETRRLFSGFGYRHVVDDETDFEEQFVQFGIAPYLGDYGDLHTWIMVKGNSDQSRWDIHLMYRF